MALKCANCSIVSLPSRIWISRKAVSASSRGALFAASRAVDAGAVAARAVAMRSFDARAMNGSSGSPFTKACPPVLRGRSAERHRGPVPSRLTTMAAMAGCRRRRTFAVALDEREAWGARRRWGRARLARAGRAGRSRSGDPCSSIASAIGSVAGEERRKLPRLAFDGLARRVFHVPEVLLERVTRGCSHRAHQPFVGILPCQAVRRGPLDSPAGSNCKTVPAEATATGRSA